MNIFKRRKKHALLQTIDSFVQQKLDIIAELTKDDNYFMMASSDYVNSPEHSQRQAAIIGKLEEIEQIAAKLQSTELGLLEYEEQKQQFLTSKTQKMLES